MSLTCEISGEPLSTTQEEVVVTPSGHICIKKLLLTKLAENGGMDPFETIRELPLAEDQLVILAKPSQPHGRSAATTAPPRPQATSLPSLLHLVQTEYDALVLELFDTRKALEDTRRELSQALYQNDAAVRVVARVSQERDTAKQELERWNASVGTNGTQREKSSSQETSAEPDPKRRKLELSAEPLVNDIPEDDLKMMTETWQKLSKGRKGMLKAVSAETPTPDNLAKYADIHKKSWHKSTNKGIVCMARSPGIENTLVATSGKDKQLVVYKEDDEIVIHTFAFGSVATSIDVSRTLLVAGDGKGKIFAFALGENAGPAGELALGSGIVNVSVHPTNQHVCAVTSDGRVIIACWLKEQKRLQQISVFSEVDDDQREEYTSAVLHPDGLVYLAGTKAGNLHVWDFMSKKLGATMKEGDDSDPITALALSNNGYHIAAAHGSSAVEFWDLRKQKLIATLKDQLESIAAVAFDQGGKYAAMGGKGGIRITTVKEWGTTASLETKYPVSGMVWSKSGLEVCSEKERAVHIFGVPP